MRNKLHPGNQTHTIIQHEIKAGANFVFEDCEVVFLLSFFVASSSKPVQGTVLSK